MSNLKHLYIRMNEILELQQKQLSYFIIGVFFFQSSSLLPKKTC